MVDDRSRVWIAPKGPADQPTRWVLFEDSQRRCSFSFPEKVAPEAFRGNTVYGVARDELNVPTVVVYTLTETPNRTASR